MKIDYLPRALQALKDAPADVRRAFFKQANIVGDTYIIRDIVPHPKK